jgi:hypothetical protein
MSQTDQALRRKSLVLLLTPFVVELVGCVAERAVGRE